MFTTTRCIKTFIVNTILYYFVPPVLSERSVENQEDFFVAFIAKYMLIVSSHTTSLWSSECKVWNIFNQQWLWMMNPKRRCVKEYQWLKKSVLTDRKLFMNINIRLFICLVWSTDLWVGFVELTATHSYRYCEKTMKYSFLTYKSTRFQKCF